jgi:hypothetical protein
MVVIAICYTIVGTIGFYKAASEGGVTTALNSFMSGTSVQFATVVLIVLAVFILCLNKLLTSEGTISILSGIVGYVLGRIRHPPNAATES